MSGYNYIDLFIILIILVNVAQAVRSGFFAVTTRLISLVIGGFAAFAGYQFAGHFLVAQFHWFPTLAFGAGFLGLYILVQFLVHALLSMFFSLIPESWRHSLPSRIFAVIPGFIDGWISVSLVALLVMILPVPAWVRSDVEASRMGNTVIERLQMGEQFVQRKLGGVFDEALTFLTTKPPAEEGSESEESIAIPYTPRTLSIDVADENKMLELVNAERAKVGAPALVMDATLVEVARAHSRDMWVRHYFSHVDPDGKDPFDRMIEGGAKYATAGENLALAPTLSLAHRGLMNSPGHKRNILDPNFRRVGIGVIDGGIYGKMFSQEFSD